MSLPPVEADVWSGPIWHRRYPRHGNAGRIPAPGSGAEMCGCGAHGA